MLVDLARNDLGRVCTPGSIEVTEFMGVERYSHVMHMVPHVEGKLAPGCTGLDALRTTFPAGTVSGAPKVRAIEIVDAQEPVKRGFYGGVVAHLESDGSLDSCISIRCALKQGNVVTLQAGAGVVNDSVPEVEFEETEAKLGPSPPAKGADRPRVRVVPLVLDRKAWVEISTFKKVQDRFYARRRGPSRLVANRDLARIHEPKNGE
jgi:anthranilate synthase component 1